jgi:hypothetical protein
VSLLRILNVQGIAGLAVGVALGVLLLIQTGETRHWQKQSSQFERLYAQEQAALAGTIANYRVAAGQARIADQANAQRVAAEQQAISERTSNDYEARLAAARTLAQRLRDAAAGAAADPGGRAAASVPGLSSAAGGPVEAARQDRLSLADRQLATEQAIQLDELIKWIRAQAKVDNNAAAIATHPND